LCKSKLKERELKLILDRQTECFRIIEHSMEQFARQNQQYFIERRGITTVRVQRMDRVNHEAVPQYLNSEFLLDLINSCSAAISRLLNGWSGVSKSKKFKKQQVVHFNEYFKTAKNWFDQSKVNLLSDLYWTPLFTAIDQFTRAAAGIFFHDRFPRLQRHYSEYLHLLILFNMMESAVSFANSGKKWLIPARIYVKMTDKIMLFQLMNEETADHRVQSKQKMSSHVTREKIVNSCKERLSRCRQDFEESLSALHQETDHLGPDHCCSCGTCPASPPSWNSTTSATVSTAVITSVIPLDPLNGNATNADTAVMDSNVDLPCLCSCCTDSDEPKHSAQ